MDGQVDGRRTFRKTQVCLEEKGKARMVSGSSHGYTHAYAHEFHGEVAEKAVRGKNGT